MNALVSYLTPYIGTNLEGAIIIILNLILIESLLSVDNAAVLASLVMELPIRERKRALRIGIVFAYIFRGAALLFAGVLMKISWLKVVGGGYLIYLCIQYFIKRFRTANGEGAKATKSPTRLAFLSPFWSTVVMVELMDLTFSIDNVFAAVAFTDKLALVCLGVFIGIIAMRVVAGYFVQLMARFPFLETVAFIIVGLLGIKLCLSFVAAYWGGAWLMGVDDDRTDFYFSVLTVSMFAVPIGWQMIVGKNKSHA